MMKKKKTLIVMMGLPASGKTTYAKSIAQKHKKVKYISRDEIRFNFLKNKESYFAKEKIVYKTLIKEIKNALSKDNEIVIVDATHINEASRNKLFNNINNSIIENEAVVRFYYIDTPIEECIKRNEKREGMLKVPKKVMVDFSKRLTLPTEEEMRKWNFNSTLYIIKENKIVLSSILK